MKNFLNSVWFNIIIAALAAIVLPLTGIYSHEGLWIAPVLSFVLFILTYLVAYLGGEWNEEEKEVYNPINDRS